MINLRGVTKVNILSPAKWVATATKKLHLDYETLKLVNDVLVNCNIYPVVLAIKRCAIIAKIPVEMCQL